VGARGRLGQPANASQYDALSAARPLVNWELGLAVAWKQYELKRLQAEDFRNDTALSAYLVELYHALLPRKPTGKPPAAPTSARKPLFRKSKSPSSAGGVAKQAALSPRVTSPARTPASRANTGRAHLLRWCQKRAAGVVPPDHISDFKNCWKSGVALCAIAHSFFPGEIDVSRLSTASKEDFKRNLTVAMEVLLRCGNVPILMDTDDIVDVDVVDEQSLMTYLSTIRRVLDSSEARSPPPVVSPTTRKVIFSSGPPVFSALFSI
jgi:hypothetical protein